MLKYLQSTGQLFHLEDGKWVLIGVGYSGHGEGLNCHAQENTPNVGPVPCGLWGVGDPFKHPTKGELVFRLTALTYVGPRNGFLLHGDNAAMNHTASDGCTVFSHDIRQKIADLKPKYLLVEA